MNWRVEQPESQPVMDQAVAYVDRYAESYFTTLGPSSS